MAQLPGLMESAPPQAELRRLASEEESPTSKDGLTAVRKRSLEQIQEFMTRSFSRLQGRYSKKKTRNWKRFSTVDFVWEAQRDHDERASVVFQEEGWLSRASLTATSWCIPAIIGALTATTGSFIEKAVEWLGDLRFGYCSTRHIFVNRENCGEGWVSWSDDQYPENQDTHMYLIGFGYYMGISTLMATVAALLTWGFAPWARGSGIPEIKTILGGFVMTGTGVLDAHTLFIKIVGLSLSVAAGLSCGKEGPLVHIACCWANLVAKFTKRYSDNEAKQRELLSTAAAAGVSVAFGAPLGGVLFSLEEVSTMFPNRTMVRSFLAAVIAALTLQQWNPTGTGKLTMFEASYEVPPRLPEYVVFILLGALGGCIGALFVHYNIRVSKARAPGTPFRNWCHVVLEVFLIALITAITSYPQLYTRVLSSTAIRALFHSCTDAKADKHDYMLDLCVPSGENAAFDVLDRGAAWQPKLSLDLVCSLLLCGALRFVQMIFTFGCTAPAGLFVPALYTGAALGRVVGIGVRLFNDYFLGFDYEINPGIYAMVGAAAVMSGVCRVTISLVVIMFELTSGLQLIIPVMLAVLTAKWVGDYFTIGIYDYCILIRKYPYLHEPEEEVASSSVARELMDEAIECIHAEPGTLGELLGFLKDRRWGGYPLLRSRKDRTVLGYIQARPLTLFLERQAESPLSQVAMDMPVAFSKFLSDPTKRALDLSKFVDEAVLRLVPSTPAQQLHGIFRSLGVKLVLIVSVEGQLVGMLTKKSFIAHLEVLHAHNFNANSGNSDGMCQDSSKDLEERLLSKSSQP